MDQLGQVLVLQPHFWLLLCRYLLNLLHGLLYYLCEELYELLTRLELFYECAHVGVGVKYLVEAVPFLLITCTRLNKLL